MHWIICPMHSCRTWNLASLYLVVSFSPSGTSTLGRYATRPTASLLPELQFITCTQIGLALLLPTPGVYVIGMVQNPDMQFSKPRYAVFKTQICSFQNADMQFTKRIFAVFKTRICSLQNAHLQFTERRRSFQNIPVLPPSHDRLNSATFPRAGIVFVALSSRRLYSIPRPYMRSSFTGCFNTCVFHTNLCPCLCSFLACFLLFAQVSKHKHKIQNTNAGFKKQVQNIYKGLLAPTCRIQTKTGSIKVNLMSGKPKARKLIVRSCVTWSQNHPAFFLIRDIKLRTLVGHRCPVGTPVYRNNL